MSTTTAALRHTHGRLLTATGTTRRRRVLRATDLPAANVLVARYLELT
ncbi:MAG: hypothetical protein ABIZ49_00745 [Opitutaceae bacterium]